MMTFSTIGGPPSGGHRNLTGAPTGQTAATTKPPGASNPSDFWNMMRGGMPTPPNPAMGGNAQTGQAFGTAIGAPKPLRPNDAAGGPAAGGAQNAPRPMLGGPMPAPGGSAPPPLTGGPMTPPPLSGGLQVNLGGDATNGQQGPAVGAPTPLRNRELGMTPPDEGLRATRGQFPQVSSTVQNPGSAFSGVTIGGQQQGQQAEMTQSGGSAQFPQAFSTMQTPQMANATAGGDAVMTGGSGGDAAMTATGGGSAAPANTGFNLQELLDKLGTGSYSGPQFETDNLPGIGPVYMYDTQGPLQKLQGYQQGVLTLMEGMLRGDQSSKDLFQQLLSGQQQGDQDLLSQIIGQGYLDDQTHLGINSRLFNSASPYGNMGTAAGGWMNQGAFSDQMSQQFGGLQNEAIGGARNLMQGLFSNGEMSGLIDAAGGWKSGADRLASEGLFNSGENQQYMDVFNNLFGRGQSANDRGGLTEAQENDFRDRLDKAGGAADKIAETGGMDQDALAGLRGLFSGQDSRLGGIADRGIMSQAEIDEQAASTKQDIMDQGREQAASLYNGANITGSPFAGAALVNKSNTDAGKAAGQERANLMKYNADSKMQGNQMLGDNINSRANMEKDIAGGRRQGADIFGDLAGKAGDFYLGQGGQRLQGLDSLQGMGNQMQDFLKANAGGRTDGMNQQGQVADYMRQLFGDNASSRQGAVDQVMKGGQNFQDFWNQDFQGQLGGFDRGLDSQNSYMENIIGAMNENDKSRMPSYLFGNYNPITGARDPNSLFGQTAGRLGQGGNNWQTMMQQLFSSGGQTGSGGGLQSLLQSLGGA